VAAAPGGGLTGMVSKLSGKLSPYLSLMMFAWIMSDVLGSLKGGIMGDAGGEDEMQAAMGQEDDRLRAMYESMGGNVHAGGMSMEQMMMAQALGGMDMGGGGGYGQTGMAGGITPGVQGRGG